MAIRSECRSISRENLFLAKVVSDCRYLLQKIYVKMRVGSAALNVVNVFSVFIWLKCELVINIVFKS